jgi:GT2 family glycosyltransferase
MFSLIRGCILPAYTGRVLWYGKERSAVRILPTERIGVDVSAVVVHHETPPLLFRCLDALDAAATGVSAEVFVIDNASRSFQADELGARYPDVELVVNERNVGFARAANIGLRMARGRYLLLLNPDAFVAPDTLSEMVEYMDARPDVGCATARLVLQDGSLDLACRRSFPTPASALFRLSLLSRVLPSSSRVGRYNLGYLDENQEAEIDAPCGAFMFIRREVVEQVGLLDERYFMYGEDLDWAYRIKRAGWRVMYTPTTTVTHLKRASSQRFRGRTIRAFHDAMRIFYRTHLEAQYPRWLSWLVYRGIDGREKIELAGERFHALAARGSRRREPAGL